MKAVAWNGPGDIALSDVPDPTPRDPGDAVDAAEQRTEELEEVSGGGPIAWNAGDAPSQAAQWAVQAVAKAGSIGIVGVYPQTAATYPIGEVMNRNLTVKAGNRPHRALMPRIIDLIASGRLDAGRAVTKQQGMTSGIEAYETFDRHQPGWTKVVVDPAA